MAENNPKENGESEAARAERWKKLTSLLGPSPTKNLTEEEPEFRFDKAMRSVKICGLTGSTFNKHLSPKDVSLVMFYDSNKYAADNKGSKQNWTNWSMTQFIKASALTSRNNHAFAAVDCFGDRQLCSEQSANCNFPVIKLYSRGTDLGTVRCIYNFNHIRMRGMVETAPVKE